MAAAWALFETQENIVAVSHRFLISDLSGALDPLGSYCCFLGLEKDDRLQHSKRRRSTPLH
jgi:hypothetical protein